MVENHLKQREVSTAEASANALREDFYHLINGQQDMQDHLHKMKNSIFEQLETTLNAVNGLNNTITAAEENRSITRNRLGSASGSSKMRGQSASPVGRLRKTSSLFSVETKNDIATARNRYLSNKERSSKKVDDTFPTSTPLRPSFSSPVVGNRKRLVTT